MGCGASVGPSSIKANSSSSIDTNPADDIVFSTKRSLVPPSDDLKELIEDAKIEWKIFENPSKIDFFSDDYIGILRKIRMSLVSEGRGHYVRLLADSGGIQVICDQVINAIQNGYIKENGEVKENMFDSFYLSVCVLWNFTDDKEKVDLVMNHPGFMKVLKTKLEEMQISHLQEGNQVSKLSLEKKINLKC